MRLAWFRDDAADGDAGVDDTPALLAELRAAHEIELYGERAAQDFVWQHARHPFDLCVYELADSAATAFAWPYLLHYPGVVWLRPAALRRPRARVSRQESDAAHHAAEMAFTGGSPLRIPLLAARLAVVGDPHMAATLQEAYPGARVRHVPAAVPAPAAPPRRDDAVPVFGVTVTTQHEAVARAAARARDTGSLFELRLDLPPHAAIGECDAVIALHWPPAAEPPLAALAAMAAGRPVITYEVAATAAWPAFDPQTWQPRGFAGDDAPAVVSVDPLDEEHSLLLAIRRLSADAMLRARLGTAAHEWWRSHATPAHAAAAWRPLLEEAAQLPPPERPPDWPAHLRADGSERTREILAEFGVAVDFL